MGFSIAMGTVLGASTLPFYDDPGSHVTNLAYGAAAGAIGGIFMMMTDSGDSEGRDAGGRSAALRDSRKGAAAYAAVSQSFIQRDSQRFGSGFGAPKAPAFSTRPAIFWTPLVSLTW